MRKNRFNVVFPIQIIATLGKHPHLVTGCDWCEFAPLSQSAANNVATEHEE